MRRYDDLGGSGSEGITTRMIMYGVHAEEEVMPILGCQSGRGLRNGSGITTSDGDLCFLEGNLFSFFDSAN